jgi:uncharacterized protein YxjI
MFSLKSHMKILVHQRLELGEFLGFETRNKYEILDQNLRPLGFAAEQGKGGLDFILRYFFGHWRSFEIFFFDENRQVILRARHPFRWYFERLEVETMAGQKLGIIEKKFSFFHKRFHIIAPNERILFEVKSPFWRIWTFVFKRQENAMATVSKRWTGLLSEAFTDKDKFLVDYQDPMLNEQERNLLLAAAVYIDLMYFEKRAGSD